MEVHPAFRVRSGKGSLIVCVPWQLVEPGVQIEKKRVEEVAFSYHFLLMALDFQAGLNRSMNLVSVVSAKYHGSEGCLFRIFGRSKYIGE